MRNRMAQISMEEIYAGVFQGMEEQKPELITMLEDHLDFDRLIPASFHRAFYHRLGRRNIYHLESIIRALVLQLLFGLSTDAQLLNILNCSRELRDYCGFDKVPDASVLSRFRQNYCGQLQEMFEHLVDLTEPVCRQINEKKADYLIYDTTGIEACVAENNPKFLNTKLKEAKRQAKKNPQFDPYKGVYRLLPEAASANPDARQQYINGHFCFAMKAGILTNGLGIVRGISFFDSEFRQKHPELAAKREINPDIDKEIGDSASLKPVLEEFFQRHPELSYKTFIGDSAFDSYDNYSLLKNSFGFTRACIPINPRNSGKSDTEFDASGTPLCPLDKTPFTFLGVCKEKHRSTRFKWVCHESRQQGAKRVCTCPSPCTDSAYGRCVYTYPDKDFRLYPGIPRSTEHWDNLYRHRVTIERTINLFKNAFALDDRKTHNTRSTKANLFLSGIIQLLGVLLASSMGKLKLYKSLRKLLAA